MKKLIPLVLLAALIPLILFGCTAEDAVGAGISVFMIVCWGVLALVGLFLFILWIITWWTASKGIIANFPMQARIPRPYGWQSS